MLQQVYGQMPTYRRPTHQCAHTSTGEKSMFESKTAQMSANEQVRPESVDETWLRMRLPRRNDRHWQRLQRKTRRN